MKKISESKKGLDIGAAAVIAGAGLSMPSDAGVAEVLKQPPQPPAVVEKAPQKKAEHPSIRQGEKGTLVTVYRDPGISEIDVMVTGFEALPPPDSWKHISEIAERIAGAVTLSFSVRIPEDIMKAIGRAGALFRVDVTTNPNERMMTVVFPEIHAPTFTETGYVDPQKAAEDRQRAIAHAIDIAVQKVFSLFDYQEKTFRELFEPGTLNLDGIVVHKVIGMTSPEAEAPESVIRGNVDESNVEELGPRRARHALSDLKEYCRKKGTHFDARSAKIEAGEDDFSDVEEKRLDELSVQRYGTSQKGRAYVSRYRLIKECNDKTLPPKFQKEVFDILSRKRRSVSVITPDGQMLSILVPVPLALALGTLLIPLLRRRDQRVTVGFGSKGRAALQADLRHHTIAAQQEDPPSLVTVHGITLPELSTPTIDRLREEYDPATASVQIQAAVQQLQNETQARGITLSRADAYWVLAYHNDPVLASVIEQEVHHALSALRGRRRDTFLLLDDPTRDVLENFNHTFRAALSTIDARIIAGGIEFHTDHSRIDVMIPFPIEELTNDDAILIIDRLGDITERSHPFPPHEVALFVNGESIHREERIGELLLRPISERFPQVRVATVYARSSEQTTHAQDHPQRRRIVPTDELPVRLVQLIGARRDYRVEYIDLPEAGTVSAIREGVIDNTRGRVIIRQRMPTLWQRLRNIFQRGNT